MRSARLKIMLAAILLSGVHVAAEEMAEAKKADPRENIDTAIADSIRLLEAKSYEEFIRNYAAPEDLKTLLAGTTMEEFVKQFAAENAAVVLKILKSVKDAKPVISADGKKATFKLKEELKPPHPELTLIKIDKYWYFEN